MARDIGIAVIVTLACVMFEMADGKSHGAGCEVGQVAKDGDQHVGGPALEYQPVGRVMDHNVKAVIGKGPDEISQ